MCFFSSELKVCCFFLKRHKLTFQGKQVKFKLIVLNLISFSVLSFRPISDFCELSKGGPGLNTVLKN